MLKAKDVALYFLFVANKNNKPINNKKLQKLVYYAQAWYVTFIEEKLFDDVIEAWVHGPAVRNLYRKYKKYGFEAITDNVDENIINTIPAKTKSILDSVWDAYGKLDADYLEILTHSEEPWLEARNKLAPHESSSNEISLDTMKKFYSKKLPN